ncbi:oligosaccharide repeat unit polymerase [Marinococcus luteus]|uniref:Oligosaccharide repeat unit polymerase n=1 Tax=Marinococcus luteus TaxID=1122204 RepID=A0A1H2TGK9_9BACI|nr:O-antigen polymerase [Marinococcus luteus]SDW42815.1 oligosaccharide repeat unit polymerase [Marinococcus luteus]
MVTIFLLVLLSLLLINLQLTRDFFHPTIIFKIVWLMSATVLLFYQNRWGVSLSFETICIFLSGFLAFDLGFVFFRVLKGKNYFKALNNFNVNSSDEQQLKLKKNRVFLLFTLVILMSSYLLYDISTLIGGITAFFSESFLMDYRVLQYDESSSTNTQQFLFRALEVIGVSVLIFSLREKNKSKTRLFMYLLILTITFGIQLLTTGRMRFLAILVQFSIIYLINERKNGKFLTFKSQKKFSFNLFGIFLLFISIFYLYGKYGVDKIDENDPFNSIAIYIASPLPAFDITWPLYSNTSEYFGQAVLAPVYNILNKIFGIDYTSGADEVTKEFVKAENGFSTNVYTLFHEQILDFGVWFVPFVMFFIGLLMAFLKYKATLEKKIGFWSAIYSMFMFSIVISFFQDTFFINSSFTFMSLLIFLIIFKTKIINSKTI